MIQRINKVRQANLCATKSSLLQIHLCQLRINKKNRSLLVIPYITNILTTLDDRKLKVTLFVYFINTFYTNVNK